MVQYLMIAVLLCVGSCTRLDFNDWDSSGFFKKATGADVRRCLAAGADVHVQEQDGWTPLHRAAQNGHTETVTAAPSSPATGTCTNASIPCIFMGGDHGLLTMSV